MSALVPYNIDQDGIGAIFTFQYNICKYFDGRHNIVCIGYTPISMYIAIIVL